MANDVKVTNISVQWCITVPQVGCTVLSPIVIFDGQQWNFRFVSSYFQSKNNVTWRVDSNKLGKHDLPAQLCIALHFRNKEGKYVYLNEKIISSYDTNIWRSSQQSFLSKYSQLDRNKITFLLTFDCGFRQCDVLQRNPGKRGKTGKTGTQRKTELLSFASLFLLTNQVLITLKSTKYENKFPAEPSGFISCSCGGWNKFKNLPKNNLDEISSHLVNSEFCTQNFRAEICDFIMGCSMCTIKISKCSVASNESYGCIKNETKIYGGKRTVNSDGFPRRVKRMPEKCHFSTNMKTSDLHCVESIKDMKCVQKCTYGYTLQEGISRKMSCRFSENKWKPYEFEECSPFIDCTMSLIGPGSLFCKTGTPDIPPQCDVSCSHYEDYPAVPLAAYHCNTASSGWTEKLPHCVSSGTGLYLVPEPRVKLHSDEKRMGSERNHRERGHRMHVFHNRRDKPKRLRMSRRKKQRKLFKK